MLALCAVAATLMPGLAEAESSPYSATFIQIDTGRGHLEMKKPVAVPLGLKEAANGASSKSGNILRLTIGPGSDEAFRLGFETTHYINFKHEYRSANASFKSKTNMHNFGMSLIVDPSGFSRRTFGMYGGVQVGLNVIQTQTEYSLDGMTRNTEETLLRPGLTGKLTACHGARPPPSPSTATCDTA